MDLPDEHIAKFQRLYRKHFGETITREQAIEKGTRLIRLVKTVRRAKAEQQQSNS